MTAAPKRLIEVAFPLREVSAESAREKSIRHGHISTLHIWWATRPLAACRRAWDFGDPCNRTIKGVLERGLDQEQPSRHRGEPTLAGAFLRGPSAQLCPVFTVIS